MVVWVETVEVTSENTTDEQTVGATTEDTTDAVAEDTTDSVPEDTVTNIVNPSDIIYQSNNGEPEDTQNSDFTIDGPNMNGATNYGDGTNNWNEEKSSKGDDTVRFGDNWDEIKLDKGNDNAIVGDGDSNYGQN